ncbi:MAG: YbaK/EbsC family protein [Candidatus Omnitrophica bacterium]|nr:YbaK/EbsC family protein [Candidatus Omnitrophota bacterium]
MTVARFQEFLDENGVKYVTIQHSPAYTAQEIAAKAHVPGNELAKTTIVRIDGELAMAVLPASYQVDFDTFAQAIGVGSIELASEDDFADRFPECEIGAMPPFGNLYGMEVYVAEALAEDEEIFLNAGTHSELIRMDYKDFEKLVRPKVVNLSAIA